MSVVQQRELLNLHEGSSGRQKKHCDVLTLNCTKTRQRRVRDLDQIRSVKSPCPHLEEDAAVLLDGDHSAGLINPRRKREGETRTTMTQRHLETRKMKSVTSSSSRPRPLDPRT